MVKGMERKYFVPSKGYEYLFTHSQPGTLVMDAANAKERQDHQGPTPESKEAKKLDLFGCKVYSTGGLQLQIANQQVFFSCYSFNSCNSLSKFKELLPSESRSNFGATLEEGKTIARTSLQAPIDLVDSANCTMSSAIVMWGSSWLESCGRMDFTEAYSDRCSSVGLAAREGNVKNLRKLIKQGYSVDVPDNRGWMPIHEAAFRNSSECLKLLINAGYVYMMKLGRFYRSRSLEIDFMQSIVYVPTKHIKSVECVLNTAASIDSRSGALLGLLHCLTVRVILEDHLETLANAECSSNMLTAQCIGHEHIRPGHTEIIKLLLEKGANKECVDDFGITPLFIAAQYGKLESLRVLLSHGANVNCQAKDKATPLFIAAQEGHAECVELLLSKGANPNLYCNEEEWQLPIHAAAQMGHSK
ncbi:Ankyrin repeat and SOCS box protein 3 [Chelonia mydas]|uniref:Ankyrin repeat and SOCS box protein 3 n=1 Tax=Chelonia mydas TaxID=8469 RepID=M7B6J8_CHEMY|nr:Ankyrin repeat and SOCS box protein 3 [Chelonia mydas]